MEWLPGLLLMALLCASGLRAAAGRDPQGAGMSIITHAAALPALATVNATATPAPAPTAAPSSTLPPGCTCTVDGVSGGVSTGTVGCGQHSLLQNITDWWCYVSDPAACALIAPSAAAPGATWVACDPGANASLPLVPEPPPALFGCPGSNPAQCILQYDGLVASSALRPPNASADSAGCCGCRQVARPTVVYLPTASGAGPDCGRRGGALPALARVPHTGFATAANYSAAGCPGNATYMQAVLRLPSFAAGGVYDTVWLDAADLGFCQAGRVCGARGELGSACGDASDCCELAAEGGAPGAFCGPRGHCKGGSSV